MNTAQKITEKVLQEFRSNNRNVFSILKTPFDEIEQRTAAAAALDRGIREDIHFFSEAIDQPDYHARNAAREDLRAAIYRSIAKAFLKVLSSGVLVYATKATEEADQEIQELKYLAGVEQRPKPIAAAPVLTPTEALEAEVIADYNGALSTEKMRQKMNSNAAYRNTYNRLSETNRLESRVTTLHDAGKVGG